LSGLPCPCCPPRLPLLSPSPNLSTSGNLAGAISPDSKHDPASNQNDPEATGDEAASASFSKTFLENSSTNKDLVFGASVAELRRKAQEHSAALWQSLQLAQQQSIAATTTLATALTNSCPKMSNPFLASDSKEINFNLLPNMSGLGGLAGLGLAGFPSQFPQMANPLSEPVGILKLNSEKPSQVLLANGSEEISNKV
jgi:hypothetical protein